MFEKDHQHTGNMMWENEQEEENRGRMMYQKEHN